MDTRGYRGRELVYEPSCLDLWREHHRGGGPVRQRGGFVLGLRFVARLAASVWYSLPRYYMDRGRLTRFGRAVSIGLVGLAGLTVLALVMYAFGGW